MLDDPADAGDARHCLSAETRFSEGGALETEMSTLMLRTDRSLRYQVRLRPAQLVRSACLACGLISFLHASLASGDPVWSAHDLMTALRRTKATVANFVETKHSSYLDREVVLRGWLSYTPPDRLEKHIVEPYRERIVIDGDDLEIESLDRDTRRRLSLDAHPQIRMVIESFRAALAGELSVLDRYYDVRLFGSSARWELRLLPTDREVKKVIRQVTVSGSNGEIHLIETVEVDGDGSRIHLDYAESTK